MGTDHADPIRHRLAVVGAGVMGTNITTTALGHGVDVVLVDVSDEALAGGRRKIKEKTRHAQLMGALPADRAPGTLTTSTDLADVADATVVVEAVLEVAEVKEKVLTEVGRIVRPGTVVISNTSCIPIDEMANWLERPEELVGVHFMNPTYLIKAVEMIRGPRTSDQTMAGGKALLTAMGREGLVVNDNPGFVINFLLHPLINSAAKLVERGVADVETIDKLLEGCLGHSTGPLRTADLIGIDNLVDSLVVLYERSGDESCNPCELMLEKVRTGAHGRKSGRGFYDYGKAVS